MRLSGEYWPVNWVIIGLSGRSVVGFDVEAQFNFYIPNIL